MPRYAPNKMYTAVKRRYFELIRTGRSGSQAAQEVGLSLSCGSLWFIDAGSVSYVETPISPRYLSQDDKVGTGLERYCARRGFEVLAEGEGLSLQERLGVPLGIRPEPGERIFARWR